MRCMASSATYYREAWFIWVIRVQIATLGGFSGGFAGFLAPSIFLARWFQGGCKLFSFFRGPKIRVACTWRWLWGTRCPDSHSWCSSTSDSGGCWSSWLYFIECVLDSKTKEIRAGIFVRVAQQTYCPSVLNVSTFGRIRCRLRNWNCCDLNNIKFTYVQSLKVGELFFREWDCFEVVALGDDDLDLFPLLLVSFKQNVPELTIS